MIIKPLKKEKVLLSIKIGKNKQAVNNNKNINKSKIKNQ
jgi:hypothetical protein